MTTEETNLASICEINRDSAYLLRRGHSHIEQFVFCIL